MASVELADGIRYTPTDMKNIDYLTRYMHELYDAIREANEAR